MHDDLNSLIALARRKHRIDQHSGWSEGSRTYLSALATELDEVEAELQQQRRCYLEDELGDLLWNYLNSLVGLEAERGIKLERVLARANSKYSERIETIENGGFWKEIKAQQQQQLALEQAELDRTEQTSAPATASD